MSLQPIAFGGDPSHSAYGYAGIKPPPFRALATHVVAAKWPRRGLLPGDTGALATVSHGAPSDLDARLLWLCSALGAQGAEIDGMLADPHSLRQRPERDAYEDHLDAAGRTCVILIEEIADTPARSLAGMRAKAAALQWVFARVGRSYEGQFLESGEESAGRIEHWLALSLSRDVMEVKWVP